MLCNTIYVVYIYGIACCVLSGFLRPTRYERVFCHSTHIHMAWWIYKFRLMCVWLTPTQSLYARTPLCGSRVWSTPPRKLVKCVCFSCRGREALCISIKENRVGFFDMVFGDWHSIYWNGGNTHFYGLKMLFVIISMWFFFLLRQAICLFDVSYMRWGTIAIWCYMCVCFFVNWKMS